MDIHSPKTPVYCWQTYFYSSIYLRHQRKNSILSPRAENGKAGNVIGLKLWLGSCSICTLMDGARRIMRLVIKAWRSNEWGVKHGARWKVGVNETAGFHSVPLKTATQPSSAECCRMLDYPGNYPQTTRPFNMFIVHSFLLHKQQQLWSAWTHVAFKQEFLLWHVYTRPPCSMMWLKQPLLRGGRTAQHQPNKPLVGFCHPNLCTSMFIYIYRHVYFSLFNLGIHL